MAKVENTLLVLLCCCIFAVGLGMHSEEDVRGLSLDTSLNDAHGLSLPDAALSSEEKAHSRFRKETKGKHWGLSHYDCLWRNPCPWSVSTGRFLYPHKQRCQFVRCSKPFGVCTIEKCPPGEVFNKRRGHCRVREECPTSSTSTREPTTTPSSGGGYNCATNNPCTPENAQAGKFYFPHDDPTKYTQCSEWGQCYEMDCPAGLVWDSVANTCNYP